MWDGGLQEQEVLAIEIIKAAFSVNVSIGTKQHNIRLVGYSPHAGTIWPKNGRCSGIRRSYLRRKPPVASPNYLERQFIVPISSSMPINGLWSEELKLKQNVTPCFWYQNS
ncbi:hypothetical protein F157LOC_01012 [Pectobacterium brasiliense]|nr:hypothetical protein F157LOC_01012 [Pectobacterium brasiliense]